VSLVLGVHLVLQVHDRLLPVLSSVLLATGCELVAALDLTLLVDGMDALNRQLVKLP
jgi:hypothetical protein